MKSPIVSGGEDTIDMVVFLIQALWETEYKQWEVVAADIEVYMLYKGKRNLPQKQRFIMLIAFGLRVVVKIVARRVKQTLSLSNNSMGQIETLRPGLVLTLCIFDPVRAKFNPEDDPFTFIFADIAKAYPSVPRPELMAVLERSGIPLHGTRPISSEKQCVQHEFGTQGGSSCTHRVFNLSFLHHERFEVETAGKPK